LADIARDRSRLLRIARTGVYLVCGVALLAVPLAATSLYYQGIASQILIFVVLAAGYNLVLGYTGQVSLGHIALFAIGAYSSAVLVTRTDAPFLAGVALAAVITGLVGAFIGIPALRVKGHYLTLLTLAFAVVVQLLLTNLASLTGGSEGISRIPAPSIAGFDFATWNRLYYLLLAFAVLAVVGIARIDRSRYGRSFKAVRDAEIGADVSGVNVARVKVLAFVVSAVYAGVAGSLYAHTLQFVSPDFFNLDLMIVLLAMVLIGGRGTVLGPVIGATLLTVLPETFRFVRDYYLIAFGLTIWFTTLVLPDGVVGLTRRFGELTRRR